MSADLVIKSNAIFDSVSDEPFSGFVAIKGNKIAAVGKNMEDAAQYIGRTQRCMITRTSWLRQVLLTDTIICGGARLRIAIILLI